jgi:protein translocase SecG subunit
MAHILHLVQIISSLVLIVLVLLQRTQGDTSSWLGGDNTSFLQTRRGAERFLFILTVIVSIVFVGASLAVIVL